MSHRHVVRSPVLREKHILCENVHPGYPLLAQSRRHYDMSLARKPLLTSMVAVEILLEGTTLDRTESVGRECTRQNAHTGGVRFSKWHRIDLLAEATFQRFVENVGHFVLEVLGGD